MSLNSSLNQNAQQTGRYPTGGNAISSGFSSPSNTDRRDPSRFWNGRELYSTSHARIAVRSSLNI